MSELPVSTTLAWLAGLYHLLIAGYLVFLAEERSPLLTTLALLKGSLGGGVYILVTNPPWYGGSTLEWLLLPLTLVLLLAFSILVTVLIFRAYGLADPSSRLARVYQNGIAPYRDDS